jgi:hypothetical protein
MARVIRRTREAERTAKAKAKRVARAERRQARRLCVTDGAGGQLRYRRRA